PSSKGSRARTAADTSPSAKRTVRFFRWTAGECWQPRSPAGARISAIAAAAIAPSDSINARTAARAEITKMEIRMTQAELEEALRDYDEAKNVRLDDAPNALHFQKATTGYVLTIDLPQGAEH